MNQYKEDKRVTEKEIDKHNDRIKELKSIINSIDNILSGVIVCPKCHHEFLLKCDKNIDELKEEKDECNNSIEKAKEEIAMMREYDYAIVNDQVPLAAERVKRVIEAEHFRVDRVIGHYLDMLPKTQTIVKR